MKRSSSVFDEFGRATQTSQTAGEVSASTTYAQFSAKPVSSAIGYLGTKVGLSFDANTSRESARSITATGYSATLSIVHDAQGRISAETLTGVGTRALGYDDGGHITSQTGWGFSGSGASYGFTAGAKSSETLPLAYPGAEGWHAEYSYTPSGRLATASIDGASTSYSFDAAGNLDGIKRDSEATTTLAYDPGNRLVSSGTTDYGWDVAHGWRTSQRRSGEASVTFAYTGTGRLESYSDPNRSVVASYAYDASGQRTASHVVEGARSTDTTWTYDGIELLGLSSRETSGSEESTWTITYFRDENGTPFAGVYRASDASDTPFLMVTTDRGDVVELTDASGAPFVAYRYDAFGNPAAAGPATRSTLTLTAALAANIASRQPLRYSGYCYDAESSTYYLSARQYDPTAMQFLTKDPAKADGEESAYQYAGGDPIGGVDPSGLAVISKLSHLPWPFPLITGANATSDAYIHWNYDTNSGRLTVTAWVNITANVQKGVEIVKVAYAYIQRKEGDDWIRPSRDYSQGAAPSGTSTWGWRTVYDSLWLYRYHLYWGIARSGGDMSAVSSGQYKDWWVKNPISLTRPKK